MMVPLSTCGETLTIQIFQFAVACATVIDMLHLGQDCIYRAWY